MSAAVGIIANPASGQDIRRLVARGSVFDNHEKVQIVRRVLLGLDAVGVEHVWVMPDPYGIALRAMDGLPIKLQVETIPINVEGDSSDSIRAARWLVANAIGCVITLGGDGTNRSVARAIGDVPLLPLSTGTNNVFPGIVEGTLAGLAAGMVALGRIDRSVVIARTKRLEVSIDGVEVDLALIDVARCTHSFVGARAVWDPETIQELVLASAEPGSIGLSAIGAHLDPVARAEAAGLYIKVGTPPALMVLAPLAPGLVSPVPIAAYRRLEIGAIVELGAGRGSLALDGEREIILKPYQRATVRLSFDGPRVIDVRQTLAAAAKNGYFRG